MKLEINDLVQEAHSNAKSKGFWEDWDNICKASTMSKYTGSVFTTEMINNAIGNRLMLIVSEISEAQEALRKDNFENFKEELADVVIRTCDLAGGLGIDLQEEVIKKMQKNKNRPYKHNKAF